MSCGDWLKSKISVKRLVLIMIMALIGSFLLLIISLFSVTVSYPWHASCKINWQVPTSCDAARTGLIAQMNEWSKDNCPQISAECPSMPCGQKCLYKFAETDSDGTVTGTHATPVKRYIDNLEFKFSPSENSDSCKIEGFSTSDTWYAILDMGTNYCNLRNLLEGTGITEQSGFVEETSTSICTQYDKIDCTRF